MGGVDPLRRAVRGAGRRLPQIGAGGRRTQAPGGGGLQLLRLAQVQRLRWRHRVDQPLRRFGTRAGVPGEFGFTVDNVVAKAKALG